ncbi:MAG: AMP-binding protein, partial [Gemmatimonadaceae bacterium]|nr:AMP-binding protein [Gemmatimonadaceae bacterium]
MTSTALIPHRFLARVAAHPEAIAFSTLEGEVWRFDAWGRTAHRVAAALIADGVSAGDRVAILAGNTPLWPIMEMGILLAGAVSVGLYPSAAAVQVEEVVQDAAAVVLVVGHVAQLATVRQVRHQLPSVRRVVAGPAVALADDAMSWESWLARGDAVPFAM